MCMNIINLLDPPSLLPQRCISTCTQLCANANNKCTHSTSSLRFVILFWSIVVHSFDLIHHVATVNKISVQSIFPNLVWTPCCILTKCINRIAVYSDNDHDDDASYTFCLKGILVLVARSIRATTLVHLLDLKIILFLTCNIVIIYKCVYTLVGIVLQHCKLRHGGHQANDCIDVKWFHLSGFVSRRNNWFTFSAQLYCFSATYRYNIYHGLYNIR